MAIFDWEMATIGDPLADVGYMMIHWTQADDPQNSKFNLQSVTAQPGLPEPPGAGGPLRAALGPLGAGAGLVRHVGPVEGGRLHGGQLQAGDQRAATDDPYLKTFGDGVVELAQRALNVTRNGF